MNTWSKLMPSWEIFMWDESNFNIDSFPYAKEAYLNQKFAFVADVARLYALNLHGGVYLDTDVELYQPLDKYLEYDFFSGIEIYNDDFEREGKPLLDKEFKPIDMTSNISIPWLGFLSAVIGSKANNSLINDCLNFYESYLNSYNEKFHPVIIDGLLALKAVKYGFRYLNETQMLDNNMVVLNSDIFSYVGVNKSSKTVLYHHAAQSWQPKTNKEKFKIVLDKLNLLYLYYFAKRLKSILTSKDR